MIDARIGRRVLFVDDEENVLRALQRVLSRTTQWAMRFATSSEKGLALLAEAESAFCPFDVVVADMRMPEVDGAEFLTLVRQRHPGVLRIVLSAYADPSAGFRAITSAHQYFHKPPETEVLTEAIERACKLRDLVPDAEIRRKIGELQTLPIGPKTSQRLNAALAQEATSLPGLAAIVETDVSLTAKVLQLVNSAFLDIRRRITSVSQAVSYLGIPAIRQLLQRLETCEQPIVPAHLPGFSLEAELYHASYAARIARELVQGREEKDEAFAAALLHDVGKLVLAAHFTGFYDSLLRDARERKCPMWRAEKEALGISHAEIGAYLLGLWGLPQPVVDGVARHHEPAHVGNRRFDLPAVVHVADYLAEPRAELHGKPKIFRELDETYLANLGVADRLSRWKELASQLRRNDRLP